MASGNIKGITIQFNGDTTKLDKALRNIDKGTRSLDKELKNVNNALKFNPANVELWRQKQQLLSQKIDETKKRLDVLKQAQTQMDASGVDKNSAEYRELQREIITTGSKLKTFEGQLRKVGNVKLTALSEQLKQVGSKLQSAGQAMSGVSKAGAAATAAVGALAYKAGTAADDLNTLSKVTGIGTDRLQKYGYAADLVDVSVESIAKANKKLAKNAYSAANGSKSQAAAFDKLGVSVTDSNGELRDSEDIFQDTLKALGTMTNETERDALAQQLMGKSAAELNPLIKDGGETYKQVSETLKKYDLDYVDQETLNKANKFNDELDTMKLIGSVALAQVGSQLAAYLAPVLEKVVDLVGKLAKWLGNLDPTVLTIIATIGGLLAVIAPLLITLGKVATGLGAIIKLVGILGPAIGGLGIAGGPILLVIAAITAVIAAGVLLYKNWGKIKTAAASLGKKIKEVWGSIKSATASAWQRIKESVTKPFTSAYNKIKNIIEKVKSWFPINLGNIFEKIDTPHFVIEWSQLTAFGKTIDYPSGIDVEWYKNGGIFSSPTLAGIGEAGPEAVVPLDKFWDRLDNMNTGVTINVYASDGMNVNELALKVEQRLVQLQKQRSKAYGI